jgi:hypothetical protein
MLPAFQAVITRSMEFFKTNRELIAQNVAEWGRKAADAIVRFAEFVAETVPKVIELVENLGGLERIATAIGIAFAAYAGAQLLMFIVATGNAVVAVASLAWAIGGLVWALGGLAAAGISVLASGIASAWTVVIGIFSILKWTILALLPVWKAAALALIMNPLFWVPLAIAAVVALGYAAYRLAVDWREATRSFLEFFGVSEERIVWLQAMIYTIGEAVVDTFKDLGSYLTTALGDAMVAVNSIWEAVSNFGTATLDMFSAIGDAVMSMFRGTGNAASALFRSVWDRTMSILPAWVRSRIQSGNMEEPTEEPKPQPAPQRPEPRQFVLPRAAVAPSMGAPGTFEGALTVDFQNVPQGTRVRTSPPRGTNPIDMNVNLHTADPMR